MKLFQFIKNYITGKIKIYKFHKAESLRRLYEIEERERKILVMAQNTKKIFLMCNAENKLPSYLKNDINLKHLLNEVTPENVCHSVKLDNAIDVLFEMTAPFIIFRLQHTAELPASDLN